jgi:hypothetical protein
MKKEYGVNTMNKLITSVAALSLLAVCGQNPSLAASLGSQDLTFTAQNQATCSLGAVTNTTSGNSVTLSNLFSSTGTVTEYSTNASNSPQIAVSCTANGLTVNFSSRNGGMTLGGLTYVPSNPQANVSTTSKVDYTMTAVLNNSGGMSQFQTTYTTTASPAVASGSMSSALGAGGYVRVGLATTASDTILPNGWYTDVITVTVSNP